MGLLSKNSKIMLSEGDDMPMDPTQNENPYYL